MSSSHSLPGTSAESKAFLERMYAYVKQSLKKDPRLGPRRNRKKTANKKDTYIAAILTDEPADDSTIYYAEEAVDQFHSLPPENELQKVGSGGGGNSRVMSEHQLRVQRSLQRLNVPDWYKNCAVPQQGFLLKRHSDAGATLGGGGGWQGLGSKTTSLSSLGSSQSAVPRSPTGNNALSPSPLPHVGFTRWSTSRLNSAATSTSTSPCGSARSSFNYRQPYLGWRSQERLSRPPRTPAERLAAGLLPQKQQTAQNTPSLNEVRTSIKEVTSAIVHYVSGTRQHDSNDRLSPALGRRYDRDNSSSRSASPRGSTGRLCWLESSFVGSRPLEVPETPVAPPTAPHTKAQGHDLYLDLNSSTQMQRPHLNGELLLS